MRIARALRVGLGLLIWGGCSGSAPNEVPSASGGHAAGMTGGRAGQVAPGGGSGPGTTRGSGGQSLAGSTSSSGQAGAGSAGKTSVAGAGAGGASTSTTGGAAGASAGGASGVGGAVASSGGAPTGGAAAQSYPKPCSDLYDSDQVPTFELEIAPEQLALIEADCSKKLKQYRPAVFRYWNESVPVLVRLKGNWSYRCEKKQFVISFNETNPEGRFHGQRKIVLDAPWYDPSLLAERLGFSFMRRTGNAWSCVNHAKLVVNGSYYGAYSNVERMDKEYLQRHFPKSETSGNLYEANELRTNEELGDVSRRDALLSATDIKDIEAIADLEQVVRVWASSAMLPDPDSYWAGVEINYAIYDHPSRGFVWFPLDMDLTMRQGVMNPATSRVQIGVVEQFVRADPIQYQNEGWGREAFYQRVMSAPRWCERFVEALKAARDAYDVPAMTRDIDAWAAQIDDAVASDPHRPYSQQDHLEGVATLKAFMPKRLAFVNSWLASAHCPVSSWSRP